MTGSHRGAPERIPDALTDHEPCRLGLCCARIGSFSNPASTRETRRLLERALDLGVDLLDTADIYGQGDSEREVGRLLRSRPGAAFVVTKVGHAFSSRMAAMRPLKPLIKPLVSMTGIGRRAMTSLRSSNVSSAASIRPGGIAPALEASLRRLGIGRVDALLLHDSDAGLIGEPAVHEALGRLVERGLVGVYGAACIDVDALVAALGMPGLSVVEVTPPVVDALGPGDRRSLRDRGVTVLLREATHSRSDLSPVEALRWAARRYADARIVFGTTSVRDLEKAAAAVTGAPLACAYDGGRERATAASVGLPAQSPRASFLAAGAEP